MKTGKRRFTALCLAVILTFLLILPATAAAADLNLEKTVSGSVAYVLKTVKTPQVGPIGGEWAVIGLARSGYEVPQTYWDNYYAAVEDYVVKKQGILHTKKYTEYSRVILALTAIGADPSNVGGYDLLTPLGDFDKTVWQGINGPVWALIALDCGNYDIPSNPAAKTQATRQMYVDEILKRQLKDGGWNLLDSGTADPDVTGMALQALANYQEQTEVKAATEKALTCLSKMQEGDGGYSSYGSDSSESVVQVMVALCRLGIDLEDERFVKNGNALPDNLLSFRQSSGAFRHTSGGSGSDLMATEQGLYGLVAVWRVAEGKSDLYNMDDVTISVGTAKPESGLSGKHRDVQKVPVSLPGKTFPDISGHENRAAMEALASRGIINGKGNGLYDPDATMTRSEFAAIVVRTLGLTPACSDAFPDVKTADWFAPYVGTAHRYGIVNGKDGGLFDPLGTITRQEAACMVARAAKLCGMDTEPETYEILNTLAQFGDYVTAADWARESLAFCYGEDILDQSDLDIRPAAAILRCEMAQMLHNMLDSAKLL